MNCMVLEERLIKVGKFLLEALWIAVTVFISLWILQTCDAPKPAQAATDLTVQWDPYPAGYGVDRLEVEVVVKAPIYTLCDPPEEGQCLREYLEVWRDVRAVPPESVTTFWSFIPLDPGWVAYIHVRAGRDTCLSQLEVGERA